MAMKIRKRCYDCKTVVNRFEKYHNDQEQHHKMFTELDFTYLENGCDGFCPECVQMMKCEVYDKELKKEWEWIYS